MMLPILLGLALAFPTKEATEYFMEVSIYRGIPDGAKERLSSPQIVTRDGQQALISVGQQISMISDIKKEVGKKVVTFKEVQTGIILKVLPKGQQDGSVFLAGNINLSEAVSDSSVLERSLTFHELFQPGETRIITFYNPQTNETQTIGPDGVKMRKKIYTGNEIWMEMTVHDVKSERAKQIMQQNQTETRKP